MNVENLLCTGSLFLFAEMSENPKCIYVKLRWKKYKTTVYCSYKYTQIAQNCIQGGTKLDIFFTKCYTDGAEENER